MVKRWYSNLQRHSLDGLSHRGHPHLNMEANAPGRSLLLTLPYVTLAAAVDDGGAARAPPNTEVSLSSGTRRASIPRLASAAQMESTLLAGHAMETLASGSKSGTM